MEKLILWLGTAIALIGADRLVAGPERLEPKDYKSVPEPIVEQPPCRWTGFYIGAHGGYSWGDISFLELNESDPAYGFEPDGFFGGGQAGFNLQLGSWFVIGVEGSFSGSDIDGSAVIDPNSEASKGRVESDWMGTIAGRVGFTFWKNRILAYAKGGAAFTHFDYHTEEVGGDEMFNADDDRTAALVGFGLEYAFTCHWSVKVEYNHLFFDTSNATGTETEGSRRDERTYRSDVGDRDLIQGGINFRF